MRRWRYGACCVDKGLYCDIEGFAVVVVFHVCEKAKVFGAEGDGCVAVSSFNFLLDQLFCVEVRVDAEFFGEPVVLGGVEVVPHLWMVRENRLVGGDWKLVAHVFILLSFRFHAVQVERNCSIKR